jgi:hypothetical protein
VIKIAKNQINKLTAGYTGAIVAAVSMLLLGILANLGIYVGAAEAMMNWHMFFSLSVFGIIFGMIEAAIITFVFVYVTIWIYYKLA